MEMTPAGETSSPARVNSSIAVLVLEARDAIRTTRAGLMEIALADDVQSPTIALSIVST